MSDYLIRAQRPDEEVHHEKVNVPEAMKRKEFSFGERVFHAPYPCTRSYKTSKEKEE